MNKMTYENEMEREVIADKAKQPMDINKEGTAYTVISWKYPTPIIDGETSRLESILRNGLLGTARTQRNGNFGVGTSLERYEKLAAEGNKMSVFFNVVGRIRNIDGGIAENRSFFDDDKESVAILFDLSTFSEGVPGLELPPEKDDKDNGIYRMYHGYPNEYVIGKSKADNDYGFHISPKIERELFQGIVFTRKEELSDEQYDKKIKEKVKEYFEANIKYGATLFNSHELDPNYYKTDKFEIKRNKFVETKNSALLEERANQIAEEMQRVYADRPDLIVPVYDLNGNMWWPEKIPYETLKGMKRENE